MSETTGTYAPLPSSNTNASIHEGHEHAHDMSRQTSSSLRQLLTAPYIPNAHIQDRHRQIMLQINSLDLLGIHAPEPDLVSPAFSPNENLDTISQLAPSMQTARPGIAMERFLVSQLHTEPVVWFARLQQPSNSLLPMPQELFLSENLSQDGDAVLNTSSRQNDLSIQTESRSPPPPPPLHDQEEMSWLGRGDIKHK